MEAGEFRAFSKHKDSKMWALNATRKVRCGSENNSYVECSTNLKNSVLLLHTECVKVRTQRDLAKREQQERD